MALPINIAELIERRVVEDSRVEYKKWWNPEKIIHTMCAFANDIDNMGGGYIIVGIEDDNGQPKFPVAGLSDSELDTINKDLVNKCNTIEPRYFPIVEHTKYKGANIIVLWVPGGEVRPYKCPVNFPLDKVDKKDTPREKAFYIRKVASTVRANGNDERELYALSNTVPFDDRPFHDAPIEALQANLISNFLYSVKSSLCAESKNMPIDELAESMRISVGASENLRPRNVGLMFFSQSPDKYFPCARIEVVDKPDPTGKGMSEKIFYGPLDRQLEDALQYIRNYILKEKIFKYKDRAEADRFYNYPYDAIEEILANAVYHKSYEIREPVTVMVTPEKMEITSLPGPDLSISDDDIKNFHMVAKRLRNRRIGDFLKELKLIEGRNTGIPTVLQAMKDNGSDLPIFQTDAERSYFTVVLPVHKSFLNVETQPPSEQDSTKTETKAKSRRSRAEIKTEILRLLKKGELSSSELTKELGYSQQTVSLRQALKELFAEGAIEYTNPDNKFDMFQKIRKAKKK
jgi:ATP-dependent DNA helicase RecG